MELKLTLKWFGALALLIGMIVLAWVKVIGGLSP